MCKIHFEYKFQTGQSYFQYILSSPVAILSHFSRLQIYLFQFRVMPFGLCNGPSTFERLMELILQGLHWERCLVYIDDILVYGKTFSQTLANLKEVFVRLKDAGLKLKPSKCALFQEEVSFLGHIVGREVVRCDPQKSRGGVTLENP